MLPETTTSENHKPRTLILANPRAGTLRVIEFFNRFWQRLSSVKHQVLSIRSEGATGSGVSTLNTQHSTLPLSLTVLAQAAAEAGLEADVEPVPSPEEMTQRLTAAAQAGYERVVAVGGDGTVRSIANGLIRAQVPLKLGIVPLGTANNIAHALNLPTQMEAALKTIATGTVQPMDVGQIGNEYFLEAAGVGLFADAVAAFGSDEPHAYEIFRIARVMFPLLWNPKARRLHLTLDSEEEENDVLLVTVANTPYLAEGFPFAPDASLTDGLFDVVIVGSLTRVQLLTFSFALLRGRHLKLPQVRFHRARSVTIHRVALGNRKSKIENRKSLRPLPVHADDHIAGETPVTLTVVPGVLRVVVPDEMRH